MLNPHNYQVKEFKVSNDGKVTINHPHLLLYWKDPGEIFLNEISSFTPEQIAANGIEKINDFELLFVQWGLSFDTETYISIADFRPGKRYTFEPGEITGGTTVVFGADALGEKVKIIARINNIMTGDPFIGELPSVIVRVTTISPVIHFIHTQRFNDSLGLLEPGYGPGGTSDGSTEFATDVLTMTDIASPMPAPGTTYKITLYGVDIIHVTSAGEGYEDVIDSLVAQFNATTLTAWNVPGLNPNNFRPLAQKTGPDNNVILVYVDRDTTSVAFDNGEDYETNTDYDTNPTFNEDGEFETDIDVVSIPGGTAIYEVVNSPQIIGGDQGAPPVESLMVLIAHERKIDNGKMPT